MGGNRYCKQTKSDSGVIMIEKIPVEPMASTSTAMMTNQGELKKEEVEKSDHYEGEFEFSPVKSVFTGSPATNTTTAPRPRSILLLLPPAL